MTIATSASISAQNTFTDAARLEGYINLSISGTFVAVVTVQRSTDGLTWADVDSYTAPVEGYGFEPEVMYYRAGVKTGNYTSGTAVIRIGREDEEYH